LASDYDFDPEQIFELPEDIVEKISKSPEDSYRLARVLYKSKKEVPDAIIDGMSRDVKPSFNYAKTLAKQSEKAPPKIEKTISKDSHASSSYTRFLIKMGMEIPTSIIEGLNDRDVMGIKEIASALIYKDERLPDALERKLERSYRSFYTGYMNALKDPNTTPKKWLIEKTRKEEDKALEDAKKAWGPWGGRGKLSVVKRMIDERNNNMSNDLRFGSINEALQYLSDFTGARVKIAAPIKTITFEELWEDPQDKYLSDYWKAPFLEDTQVRSFVFKNAKPVKFEKTGRKVNGQDEIEWSVILLVPRSVANDEDEAEDLFSGGRFEDESGAENEDVEVSSVKTSEYQDDVLQLTLSQKGTLFNV
jgi:hypothetical protein